MTSCVALLTVISRIEVKSAGSLGNGAYKSDGRFFVVPGLDINVTALVFGWIAVTFKIMESEERMKIDRNTH